MFTAALSKHVGLEVVSIDVHRDRYHGVAYSADFASDAYARGGEIVNELLRRHAERAAGDPFVGSGSFAVASP
jgi:hypothetical protein